MIYALKNDICVLINTYTINDISQLGFEIINPVLNRNKTIISLFFNLELAKIDLFHYDLKEHKLKVYF